MVIDNDAFYKPYLNDNDLYSNAENESNHNDNYNYFQ